MNITEENKAKEFYMNSDVDGIHTPANNTVTLNYLDLLKLMHTYSEDVINKSIPNTPQISNASDEYTEKTINETNYKDDKIHLKFAFTAGVNYMINKFKKDQ